MLVKMRITAMTMRYSPTKYLLVFLTFSFSVRPTHRPLTAYLASPFSSSQDMAAKPAEDVEEQAVPAAVYGSASGEPSMGARERFNKAK
jgi:hypothetical protein